MTQELFWNVTTELTKEEEFIIKKACKNRKLFVFLREFGHLIFDEPFQQELIEMYHQTGAGLPPVPPARMAMATLLQKYTSQRVRAHLRRPKRSRCLGILWIQGCFPAFR